MANNNWQKEYEQLTPEERLNRIAKILSEGVIRLIHQKPAKPKDGCKNKI